MDALLAELHGLPRVPTARALREYLECHGDARRETRDARSAIAGRFEDATVAMSVEADAVTIDYIRDS